jgi:hypothetical protein
MVLQKTLGTFGVSGVEEEFSELAYIIDQLQKVRRTTNLQVSDDLILDAAIRLHITAHIDRQRGKQREIKLESGEEDPLATERQIGYLRSLGATIPERLTKARASELIDAYQMGEGRANVNG